MTPGAVMAIVLWGVLVAGTLLGLLRCWLDNRDSARHIAVCRQRERSQHERFESGAAWVEAWALQLDELRSLPTGKPRAW